MRWRTRRGHPLPASLDDGTEARRPRQCTLHATPPRRGLLSLPFFVNRKKSHSKTLLHLLLLHLLLNLSPFPISSRILFCVILLYAMLHSPFYSMFCSASCSTSSCVTCVGQLAEKTGRSNITPSLSTWRSATTAPICDSLPFPFSNVSLLPLPSP